MRNLLLLSLFISSALLSQQVKLKFSSRVDSLKFRLTTPKDAKKLFGKPDEVSKDRTSIYFLYRTIGMELVFGKRMENKLWCITLNKTSSIAINDSIRLNYSDTVSLIKYIGQPNEKKRNTNNVEFKYETDKVPDAGFYFNEKGLLYMVILQTPYVISVDF